MTRPILAGRWPIISRSTSFGLPRTSDPRSDTRFPRRRRPDIPGPVTVTGRRFFNASSGQELNGNALGYARTSKIAGFRDGGIGIGAPLQVLVRDNNVEQAMRALKKKLQREGLFREMKQRQAYEKPSERRAREKAQAIRRVRKAARKQAQREGLLPRTGGARR